jgi:HK97 gp10 family phage protein
MEIKIECKELNDLINQFKKYPETSDDNIANVFNSILPQIESSAKREAPVRTGRLRSDIRTSFDRGKLQGKVFNTVTYAPYVHEGTKRMKARPYLRTAIFGQKVNELKQQLLKKFLKK